MAAKILAHFALERETKGALRFQETRKPKESVPFAIEEGAPIGTLYLRKSAFKNGEFPKFVSVELTEAE